MAVNTYIHSGDLPSCFKGTFMLEGDGQELPFSWIPLLGWESFKLPFRLDVLLFAPAVTEFPLPENAPPPVLSTVPV